MKKLMVSTIILLPLLILLIMLVSGAIMSLITHIYVEAVEFVQTSTLVLVLSDEGNPPSAKCDVNVFPLKASNRSLAFDIDDSAVVSVDENGVVTAEYFGETYVSVVSRDNKAAIAKRKVLVTDNTVHAVKIQPHSDNMFNGDSQRLTVQVIPAEASDPRVVWTSSSPDVLSVSQSGELTCHGAGKATVTVSSVAKPEVSASIEITCFQQLKSISIEGNVQNVTLVDREAQFPNIVPTPADATYTVEYSSSDVSAATVDQNGKITFKHAGYAIITATASDSRGNSDSSSVQYSCTDGYFTGALFFADEYSLDYDAYAGKEIADVVKLDISDAEYREILSVTFDRDDLISYNEESKKFSLKTVGDSVPLGKVQITVRSRKYNPTDHSLEEASDICTVDITRKTRSISFIDKDGKTPGQTIQTDSITFADATNSGKVDSGVGIIFAPANHTDDYLLAVEGDATISDNSNLKINKEGNVTVKAYIKGNADISGSLTLSYVKPKPEEKPVEINSESSYLSPIALNFTDEENADSCYLNITPPEGKQAECESINKDIVDFEGDTLHLVPKKGGYATIIIRFISIASNVATASSDDEIILRIYVDKPVKNENTSIIPVRDLTQNDSVDYTVRFDVTADAMEGKEVYINGDKATPNDGNVLEYVGTHIFKDKTEHIVVSVKYAAKVAEYDVNKTGEIFSVSHTVATTFGDLINAPVVKVKDGAQLSSGALEFHDIGSKLILEIIAQPQAGDPSDFVLTADKISFSKQQYSTFVYEVGRIVDNSATITLTATHGSPLSNGSLTAEDAALTIAGHTFKFNATVNSLANIITILVNNTPVKDSGEYSTLLKTIDVKVVISRDDNEVITAQTAVYSIKNNEQTVNMDLKGDALTATVSLPLDVGANSFTFRTGDNTELSFTVARRELTSADFDSFNIEYFYSEARTLGPFSFADPQTKIVNFPAKMTGAFDICMTIPELDIPGFDLAEDKSGMSEIKNLFSIAFESAKNWTYGVTVVQDETKTKWVIKYSVQTPADGLHFSAEKMTFACGKNIVTLSLSRVELVRIEFPGFDSDKTSNNGDVYKGYQQVRVFAKHSDYEGKENNGSVVDYLRVPVNALSEIVFNTPADPSAIVWTLTKYNDKTGVRETLVKQTGAAVTYKGEQYTIARSEGGPSILKDSAGKIIAQNGKYGSDVAPENRVPWIDIFASPDSADIYFGNFTGLSETDVQNDYFGNFGEQEDWEPIADRGADYDDGSGRSFSSSDGAYSYLRVEAGDGAADGIGINAHFNFNVLQDEPLVNVFNAQGYYDHDDIVLHTNLYGPEEIDNADPSTVLTGTKKISKTVVYGNGHHINLMARNSELIQTAIDKDDTRRLGYHNGASFQRIYNLTLMGSNPTEEIKPMNQAMVFRIRYAYYCDIQYLAKINTYFDDSVSDTYRGSDFSYIKNSVIRYASRSGYQLSYEGDRSYFENVVFIESVAAITMENKGNMTCYFDGFLDILNYNSPLQLCNALGQQAGMAYDIVASAEKYCEWFGKTNKGLYDVNDALSNRYVNPTVMNVATYPTNKVFFRQGDSYEEKNGPLAQKLTIIFFPAWVYDRDVSFDGGLKVGGYYTDRDMSKLFDNPETIRLLCQFKTVDENGTPVKNIEHIRWHMEKVYRDLGIIPNKDQDPDNGRESDHIEDLKNTLKGVSWPDGSGVNDQGDPYAPASAAYGLLANVVLPGKRDFAA